MTLLVTPEDAERIALASTEGKIMLVLRNPLDTAPTDDARRAAGEPCSGRPRRRRSRRPSRAAGWSWPRRRRRPRRRPPPYTVETIRGAKRTTEEVMK